MSKPLKIKTPKRYYKCLEHFPEGTERLDVEVRPPVTGEQLERWANELFPGGGMKSIVGYVILRYGAWEEAMDVTRRGDPKSAFRVACATSPRPPTARPVRGRPREILRRLSNV